MSRFAAVLTALALTLTCTTAFAAPPSGLRVVALWRAGDGTKQVLVAGVPSGELLQKRTALAQNGLGVSSLAVYRANDADQFIAVFEPVPAANTGMLILSRTAENFYQAGGELHKGGSRLVDVALSLDPKSAKKVRYSGYWRQGLGNHAQYLTPAESWSEYSAAAQKHFGNGLRLVSFSAIAVLDDVQNGTYKPLFSSVWSGGQGNGALWLVPPSNGPGYTAKLNQHLGAGLHSVAFAAYTLNGSAPVYTGAFGAHGSGGTEYSSPAITWNQFLTEHQKRVSQGYRLADIAVYKTFTKID